MVTRPASPERHPPGAPLTPPADEFGGSWMRLLPARRWLTLAAVALVVTFLPVGSAAPTPVATVAAAESIRPTDAFEAWFDVEQPPTVPFEAVQMVVDFPLGARVARHTHGGPGYITMIDSELTMWIGADEGRVYRTGESFVEPFKIVASGANLSATPASVLVTYLLPVGAAVTTLEQSATSAPPAVAGALPPGASPRFESRMRLDSAPPNYRLGQMMRSYAAGAWTTSELAASPRLLTVVSGQVQVLTGATEQTYTAGQSWTETPGQAWLSGNVGSEPATVAVSIVELPH
jgi:quercetin dioxygenase-like cupin family protein